MRDKASLAVIAVIALGLIAGGIVVLLGSVTRPLSAASTAVQSLPVPSPSPSPEGPTGDQGITGVPQAKPSGNSGAVPSPSTAPDPGSTPSEVTAPKQSDTPEGWPGSVPYPSRSSVISLDRNLHFDALLFRKGTIPLTGGELLTELKRTGWEVSTVGTPRSATIVGRLGGESLTFLISDTGTDLPEGWVSVRLIYQAQPPPEPTPSPTQTKSPLEGRA